VREHDEVPAEAWRRASIKTAANCSACHQGAALGDYDEHGVRIPR
jgi:cytochrome c peroxidase